MGEESESERTGVNSGSGMVLGMGFGIIFAPLFGPFGVMLCAAIGLVLGAALSTRASGQ